MWRQQPPGFIEDELQPESDSDAKVQVGQIQRLSLMPHDGN